MVEVHICCKTLSQIVTEASRPSSQFLHSTEHGDRSMLFALKCIFYSERSHGLSSVMLPQSTLRATSTAAGACRVTCVIMHLLQANLMK